MSNFKPLNKKQIAWRAAQDIVDGSVINLGIGIPTFISDYVNPEIEVIYHTENGMLGMGPNPKSEVEDFYLQNASKELVTIVKGGSYFDSALSFTMMRGGHLDLVFLGSFQVSEEGDIANWSTGDRSMVPSVGGAMDLVVGCSDVRVLMQHFTKDNKPRLLKKCTYPLTAKKVVKRIYTDLAVIDVTLNGMLVKELIEGLTFQELQNMTEAKLMLDENWMILKAPAT
jgi:3-oxoadipate CoA-transferase beta subunit